MEIIDTLRQLLYPAEFRIEATGSPALTARLDELCQLVERDPASTGAADEELLRLVANETWRLEHRLDHLAAADRSQVGRFRPILGALRRALEERCVEFVDFAGQDYDPDRLWDRVISTGFEGPGVIVKMREPQLRLGDRLLQRGTPVVERKEG